MIGIGLVGQGDGESGDLSLPEQVGSGIVGDGLQFLVTDGSEITFTVGEKLSRLPLPSDADPRIENLSFRRPDVWAHEADIVQCIQMSCTVQQNLSAYG